MHWFARAALKGIVTLRRAIVVAMMSLAAGFVGAQEGDTASFLLTSKVYGNVRNVRVLLPAGHRTAASEGRRYPVFYFLDGVAAWRGWGAPEIVRALRAEGLIEDIVLVAIDNGGSVVGATEPAKARASEYLPYADQSWVPDGPEPRGHAFDDFFFDELMPEVAARFPVRTDSAGVGLAGDSFAGVAALYATLQRPGRIGMLLLESPSLHVGHGQMLRDARAATRWPARVYIGVGTNEGDSAEARTGMVEGARALCEIVANANTRTSIQILIQEGGTHWYDSWRSRLPHALRYLLGPGPEGRSSSGVCVVRHS